MHPNIWFKEFSVVISLLILFGILGVQSGYAGWPVLIGIIAYLGWHIFNLYRLINWFDRVRRNLPGYAPGIWGYIFYRLEIRKRKSKKRKKKVQRLLKAFNTSSKVLPDATVVLDTSFTIQWTNNAATDLLGMNKQDWGQTICNLIRNPEFHDYLQKAQFDTPITLPSPIELDIKLLLKIVCYGQKQYLLLARDITKEIRLDQIRRDFIANASHELRTPLTVIQGSIEQLEPQISQQQSTIKPLARMRRQSQRMKNILEDLLTLARFEGQDSESSTKEIFSPAVILQDLVDQARNSYLEKNHHFILNIDESLKLCMSQEDFLVICSNLVMNAARYTQTGQTITISLSHSQAGTEVSVTDTGQGIAEQHLPRLTERFYRVDAGRSKEDGGTGLGLSIVKHTLSRYQTNLMIDSELGRGSTFSFTLAEQYLDKN
jgi:two-component system, OmpR family, phosphate regulon sensor histidine kinase PhoR